MSFRDGQVSHNPKRVLAYGWHKRLTGSVHQADSHSVTLIHSVLAGSVNSIPGEADPAGAHKLWNFEPTTLARRGGVN